MSEWQPIETCPQDGTWFLAATKEAAVPAIIRPIAPGDAVYEDFWAEGEFSLTVTHWMSLPEPPE